ncbi:MAG: tetratricopeptide repeat protein [Bacteroidota bacterium]
MAKNKSKTKKQDDELIEQDEVIFEEEEVTEEGGSSGSQESFIQKYQNYLIGGGVALAGIILFFVLQGRGGEEANVEAQSEMLNAIIYYEQDSFARSISGDAQVAGLEGLVDNYSSTPSGNLMNYYLGTAYLRIGNVDQAIVYLDEFRKNDNMISAAALAALGSAYEQQNEFAKAAEFYTQASATPEENQFTTPYYLMHAARNHESAGDNGSALEIYTRIRNEFPQAQQNRDGSINKYIARLSPSDIDG